MLTSRFNPDFPPRSRAKDVGKLQDGEVFVGWVRRELNDGT
ncbi:hypothetical protein [Coleofasciculus sp. F4-SAH-05]